MKGCLLGGGMDDIDIHFWNKNAFLRCTFIYLFQIFDVLNAEVTHLLCFVLLRQSPIVYAQIKLAR